MPADPGRSAVPSVRCGHDIGSDDVVVRVEGRPKDFLICQKCWRPGKPYVLRGDVVIRLYGAGPARQPEPAGPAPCAGCGHPVIRASNARMRYITCSRACTVKASKQRTGRLRTPVTKPCAECGGLVTGRADQRYCSAACRQRAYRVRQQRSSP